MIMQVSNAIVVPRRVQRHRRKGWRAPAGAVYVGRPTRWGNPWARADWPDAGPQAWREIAVACFVGMLDERGLPGNDYPCDEEIRAELAGRDLMCWCPPGAPCHADVLLDLANREAS